MGLNARARRARRKASVVRGRPHDNGLRVERIDVSDAPVGPDIVLPPLEDVLQAIAGAPAADDWQAIRKVVVPIFLRARPFPAGYPATLTALVPPGVLVAFAAHVGPALLMITKQQLAVLGITQTELVAEGLANLIGHAAQVPRTAIVRQSVGDLPVATLQTGQSIGSVLVLVADQLRRLFGPTPALFLAPLRDVLLGLPADVDHVAAAWLFDEFASQDPNCLPPIAYCFDGKRVSTASLGGVARLARTRLA